ASLGVRRALAVLAGAEEPLEDEARVVLRRHRRRGVLPGDVVLVGAGVAGVAVGGLSRGVAAELERGKAREVADLLRHDLVDRDAGADVRSGFVDTHAGEVDAVA